MLVSPSCFYDFPDHPRASGDPHLDHHEAQKRLDSIRADSHALCNFFARESVGEMLYRFLLAVCQFKPRRQIMKCPAITFDRHGDAGFRRSLRIEFQQKTPADITSPARDEDRSGW